MTTQSSRTDADRPLRPLARVGVVLFILVLLAAATGLRTHKVGQPDLWGDEILYLGLCHGGLSMGEVIDTHIELSRIVGHLPSAAILTNVGLKMQGVTGNKDVPPGAARLPSVVIGLLTLGLLASWIRVASQQWSHALLTLIVGSFSFIHIYYSREAYYYPGQIFYATATLLLFTLLTKSSSWTPVVKTVVVVLYAVFSCALAFSHPTGVALLVVLFMVAAGMLIRVDRTHRVLYVVGAINLAMIVWVVKGVGTGQVSERGYRTWASMPAEAIDLIEWLLLGPGTLRALLGLTLLAVGAVWILRQQDALQKALLLAVPVLFVCIAIGGRRFEYHPRYFVQLWPFITWLAAAGCAFCIRRLSPRLRSFAYVGVAVLLALNIAPGLRRLYAIEAKRDAQATFAALLDSSLRPGTLCFWDGAHALRMIPEAFSLETPLLFSGLPGNEGNKDAFLRGITTWTLSEYRKSFPLVALLEWGDYSTLPSSKNQGSTVRDDLKELMGNYIHTASPLLREFVSSGWYPDSVLRLSSRAHEKVLKEIDHAVQHAYFSMPEDCSDPLLPMFSSPAWELQMFLPDGYPVVSPKDEVALDLVSNPSVQGQGDIILEFGIVSYLSGTLHIEVEGMTPNTIPLYLPGQKREGMLEPLQNKTQTIRLRFERDGQSTAASGPAFGFYKLRTALISTIE